MAYREVSVGNTATLILEPNVQRHSIIISNEDTALTVYFGPDTSITTSNSPGIVPGGNFCEDSGATNTWKGAIYGIVSAGNASVRVWERISA
jgi:hypothetical protein